MKRCKAAERRIMKHVLLQDGASDWLQCLTEISSLDVNFNKITIFTIRSFFPDTFTYGKRLMPFELGYFHLCVISSTYAGVKNLDSPLQ